MAVAVFAKQIQISLLSQNLIVVSLTLKRWATERSVATSKLLL